MSKRVLIVSDTHCGHDVGLTPPKWNPQYPEFPALQKMSDYRAYLWDRFKTELDEWRPFDVCIANGDLIDGRGERIGSTEEIFVDREEQVQMATEVLETVGAKELYITRGTDYHVGPYENFEDTVGKNLNAVRVGDILNIEVAGMLFNVRHHIGGSQVPHTRATAILREWLWNIVWASTEEFPKADAVIRSHVHYHIAVQQPGSIGLITPGLQGYGTRYGERRMSGLIHFGFVLFDITSKEDYAWTSRIFPFPRPPVTVSEA
jgi:hypothetical protein